MRAVKTIQWQKPGPYLIEILVEPAHTDRLGHTNNVRYLEWMEKIAWEHIDQLGYGWEAMSESGYALAITHTELDYLHASYAGDTLVLGTWISFTDQRFKCGRDFQLIRYDDQKTILNASMEFACISLKTGRPAKMPEAMLNALNKASS